MQSALSAWWHWMTAWIQLAEPNHAMYVKDYHMREVKHERNWTGLFSISRKILQGSMIVTLNSLYKFSFIDLVLNLPRYRKIPKISPSNYIAPKIVTQKTLRQITLPNVSPPPPRGLYLEFALEYKVKQSKNGKFPCQYKPAQSILKSKFPSIHKPSEYKPLKKGLWKI